MATRDTDLVCLVDDDPGDREIMKRCFKRARSDVDFEAFEDGPAALSYLSCEQLSAHNPQGRMPTLLIVDLNMPVMDGFEVLRTVRAGPRTHSLPVVVMSTSTRREDVERAYAAGASAYLRKPVSMTACVELVEKLASFWLDAGVLR